MQKGELLFVLDILSQRVCVGRPPSRALGERGASRMEEKDINGGEAETRMPKIRKWFKSKTCSPQSINFIPICKT